MIAEIREFFKDRINEVLPDFEQWDRDVFGNNPVTTPQAQKYYNLVIGSSDIEQLPNSIVDNVQVIIQIWLASKRDTYAAFAELYDKALEIRNEVMCYPSMLNPIGEFVNIIPVSITPSEEDTNDNTIKIEIEFTAVFGTELKVKTIS
jgi:hypothetical protein